MLDTALSLEPERLAVQQDLFDTDLDYSTLFRIPLVTDPPKDKPLPFYHWSKYASLITARYNREMRSLSASDSEATQDRIMGRERKPTPIKKFKSDLTKKKGKAKK